MGRFVLATVAVAAAAVLCSAGPAAAQAAEGVRIISPRADALNTSGTVVARVRAPRRVTGLRLYLRGKRFHDITRRFRASGAGVRTAVLRLGRDLARGRNHLFVQARRAGRFEADSVHFTAARPRPGLLRLGGLRSGAQRAPLALVARAPRAGELRARLSGRSASALFERDADGVWRARLAAHNGLRFGRNRLTVTAFNRDGWYGRVRRIFRIRRTQPLVGAGRDRRMRKGGAVLLDGRSTRAAHRGRRLKLRWEIVSRPKGSTARLTRATSQRPRLRPDISGRYTIRLHATERRRGARAAQASPAAVDTVTVTAQPDVLPTGIPITTLVSTTNPGVRVAGQFHALGSGWVQMLVLDRAAPDAPATANNSYPGTDQGMAALSSAVNSLSYDDLVVLSASGKPASLSSKGSQTLAGIVTGLGGVLQPGTGTQSQLAAGQWSLIGIKGLPQGQANQFIGRQDGSGAPAGSMTGFLQQDTSKNYTFTWPRSYVTFDTQAPGTSSTQNAIGVGSQTYTSAAVAPGQSGFHVVWLDSGTLALRGQYTALASDTGCSGSGPILCLSDLAGALESITNSQAPALLLVASINKPAVTVDGALGGAWATTAQMLNGFGAQPAVFLGLNGSGDYTFVGNQDVLQLEGPNSGLELGQTVAGSPTARLAGLLERSSQGNWSPAANGSPGPGIDPSLFQPTISKVLAQPAQPFPAFDGPGEAAAEQWIFDHLFPNQQIDPNYGIRALYWENQQTKWSDQATRLQDSAVVPVCPGLCSVGFRSVQETLLAEFANVDAVRSYFHDTLGGILNTAFGQNSIAFDGVASDIFGLYDTSEAPDGPDGFAILGDILTIGSGASGLVPGGEGVSAGIAIGAGVATLIGEFANDSGGGSALDPSAFQGDMYEWGQNLSRAWTTGIASLDSIADLLVSDAGRLDAAVQSINALSEPDSWYLGDGTQLTTALNRSATQYMWQTMLSVPVRVVNWVCYDDGGLFHDPKGVSRAAQFRPRAVTSTSSGYTVGTPYMFPIGPDGEVPSDSEVLDPLFNPPTPAQPNNLGLKKEYFWAAAWMGGGNAVTPGFVHIPPSQDMWFQFAGISPPHRCLA